MFKQIPPAIIDDHEVKTQQFSASKAFRVHFKLFGKLGKPLGDALSGLTEIMKQNTSSNEDEGSKEKTSTPSSLSLQNMLADPNAKFDLSFIGDAVAHLYEAMNEDEALAFIQEILESTTVDDEVIGTQSFNKIFGGGKMVFLYKVLKFVLEANYPDFFAVFKSTQSDQPKEQEGEVIPIQE